ncbi:hypothetical protein Lal_00014848 [Lupinus albus]|nr:hypothetical protein Lal_00014848 [Lupinus albus]
MHSKILILDFGSQVTQLIARRVRDAGVFSEVYPYDIGDDFVRNYGASGVILSGSHNSTLEGDSPRAPQAVFELGVPVLGICYGMQTMAAQLGGKVENGKVREFGYAEVRARGHTKLLNGINDFVTDEGHGMLKVWMSHGDKVLEMPAGFKLMGSTPSCPVAAMADEERNFYALQFHPEVTHTTQGEAIIGRFVHEICGCKSDWNMPDYIGEAVEKIRAQVGTDEVILGLSGGVDSSVAAALIHRAIGDQLTCVFVDHGLLRKDEGKMQEPRRESAAHRRLRPVHGPPGRRDGPGAEAQDHRPRIRRSVPGTGQAADERPLARAGHDLPGRDRIGRQGQEGPDDQEPPQRGRPAGNAEPQAAGTAARTVQGRSAQAGRRPGPAARHGLPPPVPGPGPGRAHPRRSEARVRRPAARSGRDLHRGTAQHPVRVAARAGHRRRQGARELVRSDVAGVRRVPAGKIRRRDGRRPHLRIRRGAARRADAGLHDGAVGAPAARAAGQGLESHHQRGARHQSCRV